jgi:hypothetical protein
MANPLLYSNNADIKYPLGDFHEEEIPNDILLDLSLNVPDGVDPIMTILRVGAGFAFVAFEERTTRASVASVLVSQPQVAQVVPLDMSVDGFGWVVFGPGLFNDFFIGDVEVDLDPETVVSLVQAAPELVLVVNGVRIPIDNLLQIASLSTTLLIQAIDENTIVIDRNDAEILTEQLQGFTDFGDTGGLEDRILQTLDNVRPDANGNMDIDIVNCIDGCKDVYSLDIPAGDEGEGISTELPLDKFSPIREQNPFDPCFSSVSSSSIEGAPDSFDICQDIVKVDIIDAGGLFSVGTLYTTEPTSSSASAFAGICDMIWEDGNNMIWEDGANVICEETVEPEPDNFLLEDGDNAIFEDGDNWILDP